jgi:hypothetical protein
MPIHSSMNDEPCTREHLQAAVSLYHVYEVEDSGELREWIQQYDHPSTSDTSLIEKYRCDNCGEWFTPTERFNKEARMKAWQAALDHLKTEEVAA